MNRPTSARGDHADHHHADHHHAGHSGHDHADHHHPDQPGHDHAGHGAPVPPGPTHEAHDGHDHAHRLTLSGPSAERRLVGVLALVLSYVGLEAAGGYFAGSLALMADAGHMFSDAVSLMLALVALRVGRRAASPQRTFGFHRAEVLAAAANASLLLVVAVSILWEAAGRWGAPPPVNAPVTILIASGGLAVNLLSLWMLGNPGESLNMRGAWLHVMSDTLGSVGVIVAGLLSFSFGWTRADAVASALIAVLIVRSSWRLLVEAVDVLMEAAPRHIDVAAVRQALLGADGVLGVHDLHVWTLSPGVVAMSGHVVPREGCFSPTLVPELAALLLARFGISHVTIQIESPLCVGADLHP